MAEQIKKLKNLRKNKLAAFTRKQKQLQNLLDTEASAVKLEEVYQELKETFRLLEVAHDNYSAEEEEDILEEEGDYLDSPSTELNNLDAKVTQKAKSLRDTEKCLQVKAKFKARVDNFGTSSRLFTQLSEEKTISFADMRIELDKVEASFDSMKAIIMTLDPSVDLTEVMDQYQNLVVNEVEKCKKVALGYMKDSSSSPTASTGGGVADTESSRSGVSQGSTKRETVMLPHFSGDEKTAFLKYPIWKKQWDEHIKEYEVKYRSTMLLTHLDEKALSQIVGLETNYEAAIKQLDNYYVDAKKIIKACLDEIRAVPTISQFDYKSLVAYKKILQNNHARLKAANLEHEMSNTAAMGVLVRKFPIHEAVEFQK